MEIPRWLDFSVGVTNRQNELTGGLYLEREDCGATYGVYGK